MSFTTYSFTDVNMVISHPAYPAFSINGQGIGEISISQVNDNTAHDLAADGSVMVSKIKANNANVTISVQQTSLMHSWFKGLFNALNALPSPLWAAARIDISSPNGGFDNIQLTGVSFTKRADQPYQQQGQNVTWNFMAANYGSIGSTLASIALVTQPGNNI